MARPSADGDLDALLAGIARSLRRSSCASIPASPARVESRSGAAKRGVRTCASASERHATTGKQCGAPDVARVFLGRAQVARPALVHGTAGAAWAPDGDPRAIFAFKVKQDRIVEVQIIYNPKTIARLEVLLLD